MERLGYDRIIVESQGKGKDMAYSMTGYGSAKTVFDGIDIEVQVKTLNNRALDIHVNMPRMASQVELLFQRLVRQFVARGRVDITVNMSSDSHPKSGLNVELIEERAAALKSLTDWSRNKCIEFCLSQHDVWEKDTESGLMSDRFYECVLETGHQALELLTKARRAEGKALESYLVNALDELDTIRSRAAERAPKRISDYREQLSARLNEIMSDQKIMVDPNRLATEVALMADKLDVTEELTRIATHLSALRILIMTPTDPLNCIGKKIDFYLQELNREATTMASKSRDSLLTKYTIDIRTQIESIREQAANIQ